jgi:uncharacterized protein (TIGR03437 family)
MRSFFALWRTHSCVPCRDSSRHLFAILNGIPRHPERMRGICLSGRWLPKTALVLVSLASCPLLCAQNAGYIIDTVAGSAWIGDNGAATSAILTQAEGIAADSLDSLYIADAVNHRIRKVTHAGVITTFAGTGVAGFSGDGGPAASAQLDSPYGLAFDGTGNLYIADLGNARVRKIALDGTIATVAGGGSLPPGGMNEGGSATTITLNEPRNVAIDGHGTLYFSDFGGQRVFRVDSNGSLTTMAGTGVQGFSGDGGLAALAQVAFPTGLAFDRQGALYIADSQNHLIRKIAGGMISSIARAATPTGMTVDTFGTLWVADPGAGQLLSFPVNGPAVAYGVAALDIAFGTDGYLYAAQGATVIRVSFAGPGTVVAGGGSLASGDQGPATSALLQHPSGVAVDASGYIYIADRDNNRIRRVGLDGTITTVAGTGIAGNTGDGGPAFQAELDGPVSVTLDASGNLYIVDAGNHRVRKITSGGGIEAVSVPGLISPVYALADGAGNLYISDSGLSAIVKWTTTGVISALVQRLTSPAGLALDSAGNLYFADTGAKSVSRLDASRSLTVLGADLWMAPRGVAIDSAGDVFVVDQGLESVVQITAGQASVVAGIGSAGFAGDGGNALTAQFDNPWDIAIDSSGALYIADLGNNRVRKLTPDPATILAPLLLVGAVNAASLQPGPVAPGMLLDLLGTGLTTADSPNVQVIFQTNLGAAFSAQILSIDSTKITLLVPPSIAGSQNVQMQILNNGNLLAQIPSVVADAAPGLFADPSGQAMAVNQDGTLNSSTNPAPRGSVLSLYGTGQGVTGLAVSVTIGGYAADVLYAGPVTGYPGLLQINVQVPSGYIATGPMSVAFSVGQTTSPSGVFIVLN